MIASRIQLPKNENPKVSELDDEDKNILAAFRIVFDGYRRAQDRTRAVIKAYNELESVASSLLRERHEDHNESSPPREHNAENRETSSSKMDIDDDLADVLLVDLTSDFDFEREQSAIPESRTPSPIFGALGKTNKKKRSLEESDFSTVSETTKSTKLSIAKSQNSKSDSKTRENKEETNFSRLSEAKKSTNLSIPKNQNLTKTDSKTRENNEETNFPRLSEAKKSTNLSIAKNQNLTKTDSKTRENNEETIFPRVSEATKSTRLGIAKNQNSTKSDDKSREGNEENSQLLSNSGFKSVASSSRDGEFFSHPNDSRPSVRLSLAKSAYSIDKKKTPSGKTAKQSTLVFQPIAAKIDITCSEKTKPQSNASRNWANLFDEDYRVKKTAGEKESSVAVEKKDRLRADSEKIERPVESASRAGQSKSKLDGVIDNSMIMETPSQVGAAGNSKITATVDNCMIMETPTQIDESARSLFEDEDLEDFQISQDFLNTCMDAPALVSSVDRTELDDSGARRKINESIASTPKASQQLFNGPDSIDETFFAPGEFHATNNVVKKPAEVGKPVAGCSMILTPKMAGEKDRILKRKSGEETIDKDMLEDLELRESDWDNDLWNDNYPPTKRPLDNSFDIVPEKKRKSPELYKGKIGRGKDKCNKVTGWSCRECENYYGPMNLPEADLRRRLEACRRHMSKFPKYCTPKDFWNPEFPDSVDSSD